MSRVADSLEQDVGEGEGDALPTYENLAEAHGPNSRFGRWKNWVEKRAAERYADITPEELERRRRRGWGNGTEDLPIPQDAPPTPSTSGPSSSTSPLRLRTQFDTDNFPSPPIQHQPDGILEYDPSQPVVGESLRPAHLGLHQLGSRFLPHTTSPIRALLPLLGDRFLLIGHDDGLSVLNMFPQVWTDDNLQTRGPGEASAHPIWTGEGVFQMSILEVEDIGECTPQGVALFLVGSDPESGKEQESTRILRMYNLASLISLAKWAISRKGAPPLNLRRATGLHSQRSTLKKNRASNNFAKGLKSLVFDPPQGPEPETSYQSMIQASPGSYMRPIAEGSSSSLDSGWDVVEDLPLRWATDYVPLAVPGSRLMNASVFTFALWRNDGQPRGSTLLAVGIKSAVLLYESPKGERAFRFIKEFYTPILPRGIMFVYQSLQENLSRSVSDATGALRPTVPQTRGRGSRHSMRQRPSASAITVLNPQLSLFVVFEKKVGLIRIVNSAVGEVSFYEEPTTLTARDPLSTYPTFSRSPSMASSYSVATSSSLASLPGRRSRTSVDGFGLAKDHSRGSWALPAKLDLPDTDSTPNTATTVNGWDTEPQPSSIYIVTRGKQSFALRCPLPANMYGTVPLLTFHWRSPPSFVMPRVVEIEYGGSGMGAADDVGSISEYSTDSPTIVAPQRCRMLQLTAFNEDGLEIQEVILSSLFSKERSSRMIEEGVPLVSSEVVLGETGFLTRGGHWDRPYDAPVDLSRSFSMRSGVSVNTMATEEVVFRLESNQGTYGWQRKGLEDWRVFWIGGMGETDG